MRLVVQAVLVLCIFCSLAFAQRPKIAVYVSEHAGYSGEQKSALRTATLNTLVNSGRYEVVERSDVIEAELHRQASGDIDDDELTAFGRQLGAQYVCVADMTHLRRRQVPRQTCNQHGSCWTVHDTYEDYQVSARIINVETAEVVALGVITTYIHDGQQMSAAVIRAVDEMLKTVRQPRTADNLPRMAIYLQGGRVNHKAGHALYTYTLQALFVRSRSNGDFIVVERSEAFTRQIDREHGTQRSGHVNDGQIAHLGRQYGIGRIMVANIDHAMNTNNISARLVNVETASVERASKLYHEDANFASLERTVGNMVEDIVKWHKTPAELAADAAKLEAEREAARKKQKNSIIGGVIAGVALVVLLIILNAADAASNESVPVR